MVIHSLESFVQYYEEEFIQKNRIDPITFKTNSQNQNTRNFDRNLLKKSFYEKLLSNESYFQIKNDKIPFMEDLIEYFKILFSKDEKNLFDLQGNLISDRYLEIKYKIDFLDKKLKIIFSDFLDLIQLQLINRGKIEEFSFDLSTFLKSFSQTCVKIILNELDQNQMSVFCYNLVEKYLSHRILSLANLDPKMWIKITNKLSEGISFIPRPLLSNYFEKKPKSVRRPNYSISPSAQIKSVILSKINESELIKQNPNLFKNDEFGLLQSLVKDLLAELRTGDEVTIQTAREVIREQIVMYLIKDDEIELFLKDLINKLPDFEYVRLKKSFRRKDTTIDQLLSNLDNLFSEKEKI